MKRQNYEVRIAQLNASACRCYQIEGTVVSAKLLLAMAIEGEIEHFEALKRKKY